MFVQDNTQDKMELHEQPGDINGEAPQSTFKNRPNGYHYKRYMFSPMASYIQQ